ncbi:MAG: C4-dicarboxylate ABC transporter, partial [Candidatus Scalindua sp.]|nr:C4-dicarboxylate ABC transporter [Candidatus Scalindua sp.]
YSPLYWGMVFPLGMYTACTIKLSQALNLPFIMNIPRYFIYLAFVGWTVIFVSMIISMLKAASAKEAAA